MMGVLLPQPTIGPDLEQRLNALEREVAELREQIRQMSMNNAYRDNR